MLDIIFKHINDTYGHPLGVILISTRDFRNIKKILVNSTHCRVGGDEFVVL